MADTYDVIICGAGSGGGFLAGEIAANASLLILEAGANPGGAPNYGVGSPQRRVFSTQINVGSLIPDGMYSFGNGGNSWQYPLQADASNPTSQGITREARVVGGGSYINVGAWIRPRTVDWDGFAASTGVQGWTKAAFEPYFQKAEQTLSVRRDPQSVWNPGAVAFYQTANAMKIPTFVTASNRHISCIQCGHRNNAGMPCKYDALMSTTITQIPKAVAAGAVVVGNAVIQQVNITNGVATGVTYTSNGQTITANARKLVVLSAGAIGTPLIMFSSGINLLNPNVGKNLRAHPGMSIEAFMPPGTEWNVDRGYQWNVYNYGMDANGNPMDTLIYAANSFPNTPWLSCQVGNYGVPYKNMMRQFRNRLGAWIFLTKPNILDGRVIGNVGTPLVQYYIVGTDGVIESKSRADMTAALRQTAAIFNKMGATGLDPQVSVPTSQLNQTMTLKVPAAGLFHSQSTCRAGASQSNSVVDTNGMSWDVKNLMVCDASIIPEFISANTNAITMAIGARAANFVNTQILGVKASAVEAAPPTDTADVAVAVGSEVN